ncbi:MAG: large subunit ribosomal protein L29 [Elusimicrobia bacterium]|nr:MAG: large subunit ribosomal protein L29 [Elusimicrobiota bacterium]KAF0157499.1 MAG: large subunit ribosomal protein L29 [Elusimicrobiota bacterium]
MKSKDKENLRNMAPEELATQLRDLDKKMFQMKFKRTTAPLENPLEIRKLRRKAATIRTFLGQKAAAKKLSEAAKK